MTRYCFMARQRFLTTKKWPDALCGSSPAHYINCTTPCNTMLYHAIPLCMAYSTIEYNLITCNTMQYNKTAKSGHLGDFRCPQKGHIGPKRARYKAKLCGYSEFDQTVAVGTKSGTPGHMHLICFLCGMQGTGLFFLCVLRLHQKISRSSNCSYMIIMQIRWHSLFRHTSVSSTYPCKLVGWSVGPLVRHTFGFPISGH